MVSFPPVCDYTMFTIMLSFVVLFHGTIIEGGESVKNRALAAAAGEAMKSRYTYSEMEALLYRTGFLICAHLDADKATDAFVKESGMITPAGVGYCLAVRK